MQNNRELVIDAKAEEVAESVFARHYETDPVLAERYGPAGRAKCVADAMRHLSYLSEAMRADSNALFADYVSWVQTLLSGLGIPGVDLAVHFGILREVIETQLPTPERDLATRILDAGLAVLPRVPTQHDPRVPCDGPLAALASRYTAALLAGDRHAASVMIHEAVEHGASIRDIYLEVFQRSQHEIGRLWQTNHATVAQEHFSTAATQLVMSQLYDRIFSAERAGRTVVATSVSGDFHEIGARMVSDFFEMEGWDTFYLGSNTPTGSVISTVVEREADVLVISATLTPHLRHVTALIDAVRQSDDCQDVIVLVGGHPFNVDPDLWKRIGADGWGRDAAAAVETAKRLLAERKPERP